MRTDTPKTIYLKDYTPYPFKIEALELNFDIRDGHTIVTATSEVERVDKRAKEIFLNGEDMELLSVKIGGQAINDYEQSDESLRIPCAADKFTLQIQTKIVPEENTRLEGLYKSGDTYCTQCEAEGFRRITYYPDRPDVLTVFTVRVEADKSLPVLLSNGNKVDDGDAGNGRHFVKWHDPYPKPCYLFALVAGELNHIHDTFTTKSGRKVDLYIYVRPGDEEQCDHAMRSLQNAMKWDEDTYGLEYELDIFNIVAVSDFNMGAMENTSLNIFNTALVLAHQDTATDSDFGRVESVIAHEYFHNWSGNHVTCRDWFQLSLKEGLTVFRDQEFSADLNSRDVQRIDDVTHLRRFQFPEDAGPLAHPIRPDQYIEINNFYTMTVYEKGAEVIRMMRTILGPENYRKGTDLYFSRHDGDAATCDDFVKCMEEASGIDLSQFKLWYKQAGTPEISFSARYSAKTNTYTMKLGQKIPDTPNQSNKKPMHIPVSLGLIGIKSKKDLTGTQVFDLTEAEQEFVIEDVAEEPVPSILRSFSAPVNLSTSLTDDEYVFLAQNEVYDGFNRWEANQYLDRKIIGQLTDKAEKGEKLEVSTHYLNGYGKIYDDAVKDGLSGEDKALLARTMSLPDISTLIQTRTHANPEAIYKARQAVLAALKRTHKSALEEIYNANQEPDSFDIDIEATGRRALKNVALGVLTSTYGTGCAKRAREQYFNANNMTDRIAALDTLAPSKHEQREECFDDFYNRFKSYPLVVDKFFALQAAAVRNDIIQNLKDLREHPDFNIKNPNRVRSLYAAFAMRNPVAFHAVDGSGYTFLTDAILELNSINPQIAARLLTPMREWKRYTPDRQEKMKACLEKIVSTKDLSPDVYEIASKSLKA